MSSLGLKAMTWSWEPFGMMTFVACVVYGLVVLRAFHASRFLEQWGVRRGVCTHHWRFGDMPPRPTATAAEIDQITHYVRRLQQANGID